MRITREAADALARRVTAAVTRRDVFVACDETERSATLSWQCGRSGSPATLDFSSTCLLVARSSRADRLHRLAGELAEAYWGRQARGGRVPSPPP
jgi:hypothetical protein